jgi:hypothetical protein
MLESNFKIVFMKRKMDIDDGEIKVKRAKTHDDADIFWNKTDIDIVHLEKQVQLKRSQLQQDKT